MFIFPKMAVTDFHVLYLKSLPKRYVRARRSVLLCVEEFQTLRLGSSSSCAISLQRFPASRPSDSHKQSRSAIEIRNCLHSVKHRELTNGGENRRIKPLFLLQSLYMIANLARRLPSPPSLPIEQRYGNGRSRGT